ncbi:MAG: hypothetical protein Q9219_001348 [cf. Caloplaca sp. 3 TL-2023]
MPQYYSKANKPGHYSAYPRERVPRRKIWRYTAAAGCLLLILLFATSSPIPTAQDAAQHINPFSPAAHQPPVARNSTHSGEAKWYNHWRWLNPFSDSITDDENRSVLPPPRDRPPIYAFYDTEAEKDGKVKEAENKLLLIWRRAWWAQGFRPVILGKAEAMNNPLFERFQVRKPGHALGAEFMKWLAWGQMGTGILSNWLVLPMGSYDDAFLTFLRRGEYPKLTRYEGFGGGLLAGDKASIEAALTEALDSSDLKDSKSLLELVTSKTLDVDPKPGSVAFYDSSTLADKYKSISVAVADSKAAGLSSLSDLITSHLHLTFRNIFSSGIAVLTPYRSQSLLIQYPSLTLANALAVCPTSPIPNSCPPNNPKCTPCSSSSEPLPLQIPPSYTNTSTTFTIGTLPHPYTLATFLAKSKSLSIAHIRRNTARDPWLQAITNVTLGPSISGPDRIVSFKENVASAVSSPRSLWLIAEEDSVDDNSALDRRELEWHFGFALPAYNTSTTALSLSDPKLTTSTIAAALADPKLIFPPALDAEGKQQQQQEASLGEKELVHQRDLFRHSQAVLGLERNGKVGKWKGRRGEGKRRVDGGGGGVVGVERVRDAVEAWHLADTEAWRFVRAWGARGRLERRKWEEEERRFAGGSGEGRGEGWGRWFD